MNTLCVLGTRPEAIKMAPVIRLLSDTPGVTSQVVVTGQHRDMMQQALAVFGITPDYDMHVMRADQTPLQVLSAVIAGLESILEDARPDWLIVHGDTTSALAAALVGSYQKCPTAHVEAGLRSYDRDNPFPEELNRVLIDHVCDLHFAPTSQAKQRLLMEGIPSHLVFETGNTVVDALESIVALQSRVDPLELDGTKQLIVVTIHRRENHGAPLKQILAAIRELALREDVQIVFPVHRNPNVWVPIHEHLQGVPNILLTEPLDYFAFVGLLSRAALILTDSGGVQEEACVLGLPVLVLREVTERQEAVAAGVARLVGSCPERIVSEAARVLSGGIPIDREEVRCLFGDGHAAERIVSLLLEQKPPIRK